MRAAKGEEMHFLNTHSALALEMGIEIASPKERKTRRGEWETEKSWGNFSTFLFKIMSDIEAWGTHTLDNYKLNLKEEREIRPEAENAGTVRPTWTAAMRPRLGWLNCWTTGPSKWLRIILGFFTFFQPFLAENRISDSLRFRGYLIRDNQFEAVKTGFCANPRENLDRRIIPVINETRFPPAANYTPRRKVSQIFSFRLMNETFVLSIRQFIQIFRFPPKMLDA